MNRHAAGGRRMGLPGAGIVLTAFVAGAGADLQSQSSASREPRFEVVSIKRNAGGGMGSMMAIQPGGRLIATNLAVRQLIVSAFGIQSFQLTGEPDWLRNERYDIQAKAPDDAVVTSDAINAMLRAMLADRFRLKARRETRDTPIYELVLARSDRRLGEQLRPTSADCAASGGRGRQDTPPADPARIGPRDPVPCGTIMIGGNRLAAGGRTMAQLATMLGPRLQRMVVDKTDLHGLHDFDLQFQLDPSSGNPADGPIRVYFVAADMPPLMTAIQDQLGLRLQAARGPVEYVVVESIEPPSEN